MKRPVAAPSMVSAQAAGLDHRAVRATLDREFHHSLSTVGVSRASFGLSLPGTAPGSPRPCRDGVEHVVQS
ncbi:MULTISPECIES: hypothetical protein [unclassified Streptosporangium]|uniref:hypothetical protein n=1 Tax=unclassified Streptosporangium TaxID=2632669 RepID=UPI002E2DDD17|nr:MULTISPECIES: hypothetical protein [unclassified Streptosporangium]